MKNTQKNRIKVCYILSYRDPKYVRTTSILGSLSLLNNLKVHTAINKTKGLLRYPETILKLVYIRVRYRADVYILGFRGLEIFWLVRMITFMRPLVYDEFFDPEVWLFEEHKKIKRRSLLGRTASMYIAYVKKNSQAILTDTPEHAKSSSDTKSVELNKYWPLYVGTDEQTFKKARYETKKKFTVFFYGSMLPLHGLETILDSVHLTNSNVIYNIVGGGEKAQEAVRSLPEHLRERIRYQSWISYGELPTAIGNASVCLGGPFGKTKQANLVITGKTFQFLSMQRPVIIGNSAAAKGLFTDGKNALIVERGDAKSLAEKINWAYENKNDLWMIAKAGRSLFEEKFSNRELSKQLNQLITSL